MFAEERQNMIYERIQKNGAVTTSNLMMEFNVSIETIRRDLLAMEERGLLRRVHGGAVESSDMKNALPLKERNKEFSEEKRILSLNAIKFIDEGDIISIDGGSTAISFAQELKEKFSRLTIVTHSLDVFNILCYHKEFKVILCGGHFNKQEKVFYGCLVLDTLSKIHVQKAFLFPSAISIKFGICDYDNDICQIQRKMLECADSVYILADSSKYERKAMLKIEDMKKEFNYITDNRLPIGLKKLYNENDINIYNEEGLDEKKSNDKKWS